MNAPVFVYFIRAGYQGLVKIGVSHDPNNRLSDLQVACPVTLMLEDSISFSKRLTARKEERKLHEHFKDKRVRGEWFRVSKTALREFVRNDPDRQA